MDLLTGHGAFTVKVGCVIFSMGSGIRSSAANDLNLLLKDPGKRLFQFSLDRLPGIRQPLPSLIACAFIAQIYANITHILPIPLLPPAPYLRKTGNFL